jgi:ATP-dependent Lon protease
LPWENRNDLKKLPEVVVRDCEFITAKTIKDVIGAAIVMR